MGLMGTLAKVAVGYAAARGVDKASGGQGIGALLSQLGGGTAGGTTGGSTGGGLQGMLGGLTGAAGGAANQGAAGLQGMLGKLGGAGGQNPLGGLLGGGAGSTGGGLGGGLMNKLGGMSGGAGMAGLLAAAGGVAASAKGGAAGLLDQFNTQDTDPAEEEAAGLMLRAMIQAAKSDGQIDDGEKAKILDLLGDDTSAEDMEFVQAQLAAEVDIAGLAADTPEGQEGQVYAMSLMAIDVDSGAEAQYLDQLAQALGLDHAAVNDLHAQMGVQALYG